MIDFKFLIWSCFFYNPSLQYLSALDIPLKFNPILNFSQLLKKKCFVEAANDEFLGYEITSFLFNAWLMNTNFYPMNILFFSIKEMIFSSFEELSLLFFRDDLRQYAPSDTVTSYESFNFWMLAIRPMNYFWDFSSC